MVSAVTIDAAATAFETARFADRAVNHEISEEVRLTYAVPFAVAVADAKDRALLPFYNCLEPTEHIHADSQSIGDTDH